MDFSTSQATQALSHQLQAFMDQYVLPYNPAWHHAVATGDYPPTFLEDLKTLAREAGLWNLFLPELQVQEPGTRLSHSAYAPLAEIMGRLPWAAEVFNCQAPIQAIWRCCINSEVMRRSRLGWYLCSMAACAQLLP